MLLLAAGKPAVSNTSITRAPEAEGRLKPEPAEPAPKPLVAWNAHDVADKAQQELARRGYDWD